MGVCGHAILSHGMSLMILFYGSISFGNVCACSCTQAVLKVVDGFDKIYDRSDLMCRCPLCTACFNMVWRKLVWAAVHRASRTQMSEKACALLCYATWMCVECALACAYMNACIYACTSTWAWAQTHTMLMRRQRIILYGYMHTHVYTYIYIYIYTYIDTHTHIYIYVCVHINIDAPNKVHICTYCSFFLFPFFHVCMYVCMYVCIYIYMYTYTHINTYVYIDMYQPYTYTHV